MANGPDVHLVRPARGKRDSHRPVRVVVDGPARGALLDDDAAAHATASPGAAVRERGDPSLDLRGQVAERVDLAVGVGERRAHLAAPVLERHDSGEPAIPAEIAGPVRPDRHDPGCLLRGERREVTLVALREHHHLARAQRRAVARVRRVGHGRRLGHERREPVVEDSRLVAERELWAARAERAPEAVRRAPGDRTGAARGGAVGSDIAGRAHRDPRPAQLVAPQVEAARLHRRGIRRGTAANLPVDVDPPAVRQVERRPRHVDRMQLGDVRHRSGGSTGVSALARCQAWRACSPAARRPRRRGTPRRCSHHQHPARAIVEPPT